MGKKHHEKIFSMHEVVAVSFKDRTMMIAKYNRIA